MKLCMDEWCRLRGPLGFAPSFRATGYLLPFLSRRSCASAPTANVFPSVPPSHAAPCPTYTHDHVQKYTQQDGASERSWRGRCGRRREKDAHRALDVVTSFMFCCYDLGEAPLGLALLSLQLWDWWMAFRDVAVPPRLCGACGRRRKGQDDGTHVSM